MREKGRTREKTGKIVKKTKNFFRAALIRFGKRLDKKRKKVYNGENDYNTACYTQKKARS